MGASQPKPSDAGASPLDNSAFRDWSGRLVDKSTSEPMDPRLLNDIVPDDPLEGIDYQMIPYRVLESLRKKIEKDSMAACRNLHEEAISCFRFMSQNPKSCKPILRKYYKCMAGWRDDNDDLYYQLVKDTLEGKLLEKYRRRQTLLEQEWKNRFPDLPMPRAHVPLQQPGNETTHYLHELDKDLVSRDLAMQRLAEMDAEEQNLSVAEYKQLDNKSGTAPQTRAWQPIF
eukprot:TRINITY_DN37967_c0_g1_i1.p1 TRINITY_DN37967_c0_g1~~TRINITY_DN37967_c0_g1_i1.p1  ORF type:complete len:246 (+),score=67.22 TRINITY_DN37967_c0_g1_i1:52-738(+)